MRYVVTGAAGFIGSHLAEALTARGHEVVGLDAFTDYYDPALKEENARGLEVARVDLAEDELDFDGFDGVFHLAGQPGVRSFGDVFPLYVRGNLLASQRVFEAASAAGVRVVFASSSSVYGDAERYPTREDATPVPISPYGVTKLTCEHLAHAYARGFGLDVVTLRYFTVYGPRQRPDMAFARILEALLEGQPFELFGDGSQLRDLTYVDDVVDAFLAAGAHDSANGHIFNVGGTRPISLRELTETLIDVAGSGSYQLVPFPRERTAIDIGSVYVDDRKLRTALGWEPKVDLREGLQRTIDFYRQHRAHYWEAQPALSS